MTMVASASPLGNAGAGIDSKDGREARRRRTTEKDEKLSDNGTKEKEKVMEDGLSLEDRKARIEMMEVRLDLLLEQERLMKQYEVIRQTREAYRISCEMLTKQEEENVDEDWVEEDSQNWAAMKLNKKQYDDMLTEYTTDYKKYRENMKATMDKAE